MAEVTLKQLHKIMDKPENLRNWLIIGAEEEHGRTTLAQVLDDRAGVRLADPSAAPPKRPPARAPPPDGDEEQEGECRSGGISLYHREILPEPEPPEEPEEDPHGHVCASPTVCSHWEHTHAHAHRHTNADTQICLLSCS